MRSGRRCACRRLPQARSFTPRWCFRHLDLRPGPEEQTQKDPNLRRSTIGPWVVSDRCHGLIIVLSSSHHGLIMVSSWLVAASRWFRNLPRRAAYSSDWGSTPSPTRSGSFCSSCATWALTQEHRCWSSHHHHRQFRDIAQDTTSTSISWCLQIRPRNSDKQGDCCWIVAFVNDFWYLWVHNSVYLLLTTACNSSDAESESASRSGPGHFEPCGEALVWLFNVWSWRTDEETLKTAVILVGWILPCNPAPPLQDTPFGQLRMKHDKILQRNWLWDELLPWPQDCKRQPGPGKRWKTHNHT